MSILPNFGLSCHSNIVLYHNTVQTNLTSKTLGLIMDKRVSEGEPIFVFTTPYMRWYVEQSI